jgi:[acyl-carrier-protein] S-malonyltransferase
MSTTRPSNPSAPATQGRLTGIDHLVATYTHAVIAFLFPGQGSLRPGMGSPWVETPSWSVVPRLSEILGRDLAALLLVADAETIQATGNAQAATFALSLVVLDRVRSAGVEAEAVAGHSLGEYTALVAAGALREHEAMKLVGARGDAMQAAADARPGTMAAVLGADPATVEAACAEVRDVWVANDNAPGQVVVAGGHDAIREFGATARKHGASRVMALTVGGAFHCPLMSDAQQPLDAALTVPAFSSATLPVVTNVDALPHQDTDWTTLLSAQLCRPVRWRESLLSLAALGVTTFVEIGPGDALSGMVKRTVTTAARHAVGTPAAADALLDAAGA